MTISWDSPDGHTWSADVTHTPDGITRYLESLVDEIFRIGFEPNMRRLGSMLVGLRSTSINRRLYQRPVFVGAPDRPPKPGATAQAPPRLVFTLLFAVHPELRRRRRNARRTLVEKPWRTDRRRWRAETEARWTAELLALGAVDLAGLDDEALVAHTRRCTDALRDGFAAHLGLVSDPVPVGDWLRTTNDLTGTPPAEALGALIASTDYRIETLAGLGAVAEVIRADSTLRARVAGVSHIDAAGAAALLAELRAHASIGAALERWLAHFGPRIVEACDVSGYTLGELPEIIVRGLAALVAADAPAREPDPRQLDALRDRVPVDTRPAWAEATAEAKAAYGFHDENVRVLVAWPCGLTRLALLEVGRRLVARDRLHAVEHIVEARPGQIGPLLRGDAAAPTADHLRDEYAERIRLAAITAPATVGPPPASPPFDRMPADVARVNAAVFTYLELVDMTGRTPVEVEHVTGLPVNAGIYEGRACLVTGPGDFGKLRQGDVLVTRFTSPTYDVVLPLLGAAVTDRGGALCHAAIVAREFGIPAVVGCRDATRRIPDGARIRVDGTTGDVVVLAPQRI